LISCVTPKKLPSVFDTNPDLLNKQFTQSEIARIQNNFKTDPAQYSQDYGDLILWQMYQKSPEVSEVFAQVQELEDGINEQEANAIEKIFYQIKDMEFPIDFFKKESVIAGERIYRIKMEWNGNKNSDSDFSGNFLQIPGYSSFGTIIDVKPIGFETSDKIDYEALKTRGELIWKSKVNKSDTDGMIVTFKFPYYNEMRFGINDRTLAFDNYRLLTKSEIFFSWIHNLEGDLKIKKIVQSNLSPEFQMIKDIVTAEEGKAIAQSLLWYNMDSRKDFGENPLPRYPGALEFITKVWKFMERERWDDFYRVANRLITPELASHWRDRKIGFGRRRIGYTQRAITTFEDRIGVCSDHAELMSEIFRINKSGYQTCKKCIPDHVYLIIEKDGLFWRFDTRNSPSICGPVTNRNKLLYGSLFECGPGVNP